MENTSSWTLLRGSNAEQKEGLRLVQQRHAEKPTASHIMELGVAHLWLRQYRSAWEHFHETATTYPRRNDVFFGMAGVAKWCLGEPKEAVSIWRAGLKPKYSNSRELGLPLLLFFASVLEPETFDKNLAEQLLVEKKKYRLEDWPVPLAKLLRGQLSEDEFKIHLKGVNDRDTRSRLCQTNFYATVLQLSHSKNISAFREAMRKSTDTSQSEWLVEEYFVSRLWHAEFFLARHEGNLSADQLPSL